MSVSSESDSDSEIGGERDLTELGLSSSTLAALLEFLPKRKFDDEDDNGNHNPDQSNILPVPLTESFEGMQITSNHASNCNNVECNKLKQNLLVLQPSTEADSISCLLVNGVIRLNNLVDSELCDTMLSFINIDLAREIELNNPMTRETGFGNVLCPENRWDLYLRNEGICKDVLTALLGAKTVLSRIFDGLFDGKSADFHELSAMISDPGACSQAIHPDIVYNYTTSSPMYTVFLALQDINEDMGATIFLPRTNNARCHWQNKNTTAKAHAAFLATCEYRQGLLRKGDVAIMDSRLLHSGGANTSAGKRRALFYFTLRNPLVFPTCLTPIPRGSKWADLELSTGDFKTN